MDRQQLQMFRERLLAWRSEIEDLNESRKSSSNTVELDQTRTGRLSRMDALQGQAMAKAGQARSEIELRRVNAALERLDSDDFGYCIDCDEEIALARLAANPTVTLCIKCASARETP